MLRHKQTNFGKQFTRRHVVTALGGLAAATPFSRFILNDQARAADDNTVRILGVSTAEIDDWSGFERDTGLKMQFVGTDDDRQVALQEIVVNKAGDKYDLFIYDTGLGLVKELGPKGHFTPIDGNQIPNWAGVPEDIRSNPNLISAGQQFGCPFVYNADSFGYYADAIDEAEPLSWALIFNSPKTLGKVALDEAYGTSMTMAAVYLKHNGLANIAEPSNPTPEEAKTVVDFLIERKKAGQFRSFWGTWEEAVGLMSNREVVIENCWEPVVHELRGQGKDVRYAYTKEGYLKWMIGAYIPAQAKDRGTLDKSYRALNWFLGGEYAAKIAITRGYLTGRMDLALETEGLTKDQIATIGENIEKVKRKFSSELTWYVLADHVKEVEAEWERFKQA